MGSTPQNNPLTNPLTPRGSKRLSIYFAYALVCSRLCVLIHRAVAVGGSVSLESRRRYSDGHKDLGHDNQHT